VVGPWPCWGPLKQGPGPSRCAAWDHAAVYPYSASSVGWAQVATLAEAWAPGQSLLVAGLRLGLEQARDAPQSRLRLGSCVRHVVLFILLVTSMAVVIT
jgi:hypothetical protein